MMQIYLPNIPRIWTAIAEWAACVAMIMQLPKNRIKNNYYINLALFLVGQMGLQYIAGKLPLVLWLVGMLINFAWMFITILGCEKEGRNVLIYHTCKAFIYAEFVAALAWQIICYIMPYLSKAYLKFSMNSLLIVIYLLLFYFFYKIQHHEHTQYAILNITKKAALNIILITVMIFTISNIGFAFKTHNPLLNNLSTIFMMRTFVDLCGILLINLQETQRYEHYLHEDLMQMNNMFQSQYEQYQAYRESSETVNRRFHDLKHQLDIIALESDSQKRKDYIDSLRNDIKQFKADVKTGNSIADVILTRKNAYCIQNNITFTCIADGSLLNQIQTMDLCSLLGNSLDNAIEAVMKIPDTEKRLIDLRIDKKAGFIIYNLRNYNVNKTNFENGLPATTKTDKTQPHGYGLKSIRYIAKKYNGTLTLNNKDNWFALRLMIPDNAEK